MCKHPSQFDVEFERINQGRCPRCGSEAYEATDFYWSGDEEVPCDYLCRGCGFGYSNPWVAYIQPNEAELERITAALKLYEEDE